MTDPLEGFWVDCGHEKDPSGCYARTSDSPVADSYAVYTCPGRILDIEALGRLVDAVRVALHKVDHCCGCLNYDEGDALRAALPERSE